MSSLFSTGFKVLKCYELSWSVVMCHAEPIDYLVQEIQKVAATWVSGRDLSLSSMLGKGSSDVLICVTC